MTLFWKEDHVMSNYQYQLETFRNLHHLSQKQVSEYLGITPSAYHHYEAGIRIPGADVLEKLAVLYNLEEPILGVYPKNAPASPLKEFSVTDLTCISPTYSTIPTNNSSLLITENQFKALFNYFSNADDKKEKLLREIATSNKGNDGKLYEALVYTWLNLQAIPFSTQIKIKAENCLKRNDYVADGELDNYCVFDVKMFGLSHPNITRLQKKLNSLCQKNNPKYMITISGQVDVPNEILQEALRDADKIYAKLFATPHKSDSDFLYQIEDTNLTIRATNTSTQRLIINESEINPYKWARENQYFFFHDCSQFCINKPYVIICPYDFKTARHFTNSFRESTHAAFRSLCRRMFFGMPDNIYAQEFDNKCLPKISLREASKCISAVIFQNVSMNTDISDETWIYLNPNANILMPRYLAEYFRFHSNSLLDDFCYDNY